MSDKQMAFRAPPALVEAIEEYRVEMGALHRSDAIRSLVIRGFALPDEQRRLGERISALDEALEKAVSAEKIATDERVRCSDAAETFRTRYKTAAQAIDAARRTIRRGEEDRAELQRDLAAADDSLREARRRHEYQRMRAESLVAEGDELRARIGELEAALAEATLPRRVIQITEESHPVEEMLPPVVDDRFTPTGLDPVRDTVQDVPKPEQRVVTPMDSFTPLPPAEWQAPEDGREAFLALAGILLILAGATVAFIWWVS